MNNILKNDLKFPKTIVVDTCSYCNLKCSMCPHVNMIREKGRMNWELYTKIIDETAENSLETRVWLVFFGEALILKKTKPSIFDMIDYAKGKGLKDVVINTNGNLMDKKTSDRLLKVGIDGIYIGIDAFSEDTYKKLRVGGDYNKTVANVLDLIDLRDKTRSHVAIQVQFVEMEQNKHEMAEFKKFWLDRGAAVKIRQRVSWGGLVKFKNDLDNQGRHHCYWVMDTVSITDTGNVVTCAADPEGRLILGNINNETIRSVWDGSLAELRKKHRSSDWENLPEPCKSCDDWMVSYKDVQFTTGRYRSLLKKIKRYIR